MKNKHEDIENVFNRYNSILPEPEISDERDKEIINNILSSKTNSIKIVEKKKSHISKYRFYYSIAATLVIAVSTIFFLNEKNEQLVSKNPEKQINSGKDTTQLAVNNSQNFTEEIVFEGTKRGTSTDSFDNIWRMSIIDVIESNKLIYMESDLQFEIDSSNSMQGVSNLKIKIDTSKNKIILSYQSNDKTSLSKFISQIKNKINYYMKLNN